MEITVDIRMVHRKMEGDLKLRKKKNDVIHTVILVCKHKQNIQNPNQKKMY